VRTSFPNANGVVLISVIISYGVEIQRKMFCVLGIYKEIRWLKRGVLEWFRAMGKNKSSKSDDFLWLKCVGKTSLPRQGVPP
jgi:hypothetical protein